MLYSEKYPPLKSGYTYHILNQGNNHENLFLEEKNYFYFLKKYKQFLSPIADTYAYCLFPNHFHLMIKIKSFEELNQNLPSIFPIPNLTNTDREFFNSDDVEFDENISKLISRRFASFFGSYSMAMNKTYDRKGKLFSLPFDRIEVMNEIYFERLICYIHRNPVHHNFFDSFVTWPHSSYNQILEYLQLPISLENKNLFVDLFEIIDFPFLKEWFKDSKTFSQRHEESLKTLHDIYLLE